MSTTPPRVFISATSADLSSVRQLVTDALLTMGCHPVSQNHFSPDYRTVSDMLEEKIKPCQALIHIVGHRYGAEPDPEKLPPGTKRRSYTQMEYDTARKLGIKTYVFVCPEGFPYDPVEKPEPDELQELQKAHREAILEGEWVYTPVEDRSAVSSSVQKLQLELDELRGTIERGRRHIFAGIAALIAVLLLVTGGIFWIVQQSGRQTDTLSQIQSQLDQDRKLLAAVLAKTKEMQRQNAELTAAQRMEAAIREVAEEQSVPEEEIRGTVDLFAESVEVDSEATPYDQALVALTRGDYDKAAALVQEEIVEAEASDADKEVSESRLARAYSLLGDVFYAALRFEDAVAAFQKAAGFLDPARAADRWSEAKFWAASSLQKLGRDEEAQTVLREIAETRPVAASSNGNARQPEDISLKVPSTAPMGSQFVVNVSGVGDAWDYLTIVPMGAPPEAEGNYAYVREDGPVQLSAELTPGTYEVRLISRENRRVLASSPIKLTSMDVTVDAPEEVPAGAEFQAEWTGPDGSGDYLTIVEKGADQGRYKGWAYTRNGSPSTLRAADTPGDYEVRYVSGQGAETLASSPVKVLPTPATVGGPEKVVGGSTVKVPWTGPAHKGDYITIVEAGAAEGKYNSYDYTRSDDDRVAEVRAPEEPGAYEIRYVTGFEGKTIATAPLEITPIIATVSAPEEAIAGSEVPVTWSGPAHQGDYVTIVEKGTPDNKYKHYFYPSRSENPGKVLSVETPGEAEVRYITAGGNVAARDEIRLTAPTVRFLDPPAQLAPGTDFQIQWEGPDNPQDYITIAKPEADARKYEDWIATRKGHQNNELRTPEEPGDYEIRYITGQEHNILARTRITVQ